MTVSATPIIETTRAAAATILNELSIAPTPILGRMFEDLLTLTRGAFLRSTSGETMRPIDADRN